MMRQVLAEGSFASPGRAAGALLLLLGLAFLSGCQGVSAGGSQNPTGTLSLAKGSLDFGNVAAGSTATLNVSATNSGNASVTVSGVAISSKYFSLVYPSIPVIIPAGQSVTATLKFAPDAVGSFSGTATITSDATNAPTTLSLSGTGVTTSQLALSPDSLAFGSVTTGSQSNRTVTLTNQGAATVNVSQVVASGPGFKLSGITTPLTLNGSQSTTFTVTFAPQSTGAENGNVTVTSDAANATISMPLSGTGVAPGALGSNPTSLSFGSVTVGSNQSLSETVTNTGGSSVTISQVGVSGTGFSLSGITAPVTLTAGQSASFSVTFTPASAGSVSGNVTITSNATNPTLTIPLSGTGTAAAGQLTVTPATLALGSVVVGTSGTASGSLTASGANVTVTAAGTNNSVFSVSGLSLPVTIPAGQSTSFTVTFSPLVSGAASATLTFTSNAQPATTTEALTGTGTPAPTHTVNLSWNASTSSNISGYNIYRAVYVNSCGSFSKINSVLNTGLLYSDLAVVDGTSYCYATTAVNTSNEESGYSNIVSNVQIPPP
jgi:centrosomal CEP192-like protein/uncharacterized protein DUF1573/ASPM-SPD-2-Hydin domain-containing protein